MYGYLYNWDSQATCKNENSYVCKRRWSGVKDQSFLTFCLGFREHFHGGRWKTGSPWGPHISPSKHCVYICKAESKESENCGLEGMQSTRRGKASFQKWGEQPTNSCVLWKLGAQCSTGGRRGLTDSNWAWKLHPDKQLIVLSQKSATYC